MKPHFSNKACLLLKGLLTIDVINIFVLNKNIIFFIERSLTNDWEEILKMAKN